MKNTILFFFCILFTIEAQAQDYWVAWSTVANPYPSWPDSIVFGKKDTASFSYKIDSSHIWQIGRSHKTAFDSVIGAMTDTLNPYPVKRLSYIQIKIPMGGYLGEGLFLGFEHTYQTDSLHAKCYLTESYDSGQTWHNIAFDSSTFYMSSENFYYNPAQNETDTCFTGKLNGWVTSSIEWQWVLPDKPLRSTHQSWFGNYDTMYVRFNFQSDSTTNTTNAGWCIRNITVGNGFIRGGGVQDITALPIKTYPNPCTEMEYIDLRKLPVGSVTQLQVNDMLDRTIYAIDKPQGYLTIDTHTWAQGTYIIKLIAVDGNTYTHKLTKQ